ncbi:SspB family protein [Pararhodospirillum photometricum]|uniref:SspB family protein n=1 Tax=Pararhodospirillum photometricum TaxID=1084 RepID=UPI00030AA3B9|nr:ClpXP protease specificity-enhancing factor SspB [Pararhodospirillum photometricum]
MEDRITQFAYDQMVERALRGVMREALLVTERQGLPGQHHFYITFRTDHPGAVVPPRLKSQHPDAMTIVLQNQFWDLAVNEEGFVVSLSFGGRRERLEVPFESVTAFADPHATFGLQFHVTLDDGVEEEGSEDEPSETPDSGTAPAVPDPSTDPNNVITLDRFRKKP